MANQISVLKQTELCGQQFMVYGSTQEPLFVASDVATMLNHPNTSELVKLVDDDEKLTSTILRSGQNREVWMLTENGLYEVLMLSRKPIAKQFKKGVKAILKEIRKNGGYITTTQEDTPELIMARALQVAQATITKYQQVLEQANERISTQDNQTQKLHPKADLADAAFKACINRFVFFNKTTIVDAKFIAIFATLQVQRAMYKSSQKMRAIFI